MPDKDRILTSNRARVISYYLKSIEVIAAQGES